MQILSSVILAFALAQSQHHAAAVMGFDQDKTTHHFYLFEDGGAIDVSVKDSADAKNRDAIRGHLPHMRQARFIALSRK